MSSTDDAHLTSNQHSGKETSYARRSVSAKGDITQESLLYIDYTRSAISQQDPIHNRNIPC